MMYGKKPKMAKGKTKKATGAAAGTRASRAAGARDQKRKTDARKKAARKQRRITGARTGRY